MSVHFVYCIVSLYELNRFLIIKCRIRYKNHHNLGGLILSRCKKHLLSLGQVFILKTMYKIRKIGMFDEKGFSLIELIVVIAIIALLMGVAYPTYTHSIKASRRADAQAVLVSFAQAMEQEYITNGTYAMANGDIDDITIAVAPVIFPTQSPINGSDKYYDLKIHRAYEHSFEIRAEPIGVMAGDGYLALTSSATKRWNHNGVVQNCWKESC